MDLARKTVVRQIRRKSKQWNLSLSFVDDCGASSDSDMAGESEDDDKSTNDNDGRSTEMR